MSLSGEVEGLAGEVQKIDRGLSREGRLWEH